MSVYIRYQLLGNYDLQDHGKLDGNLMLLVGFKNIHDTADSVGCACSVQAGKNQMAGFSSSHGRLDRLMVTHFSQKDHVRALAESGTQGYQIVGSIGTDLTLADDTFVMAVQIFQRVLQGNDMSFPAVVDLVNDAGHCGGFSASSRTCDQNHPFCKLCSIQDSRRNVQIPWIWKIKSNNTDNGSKRTSLPVCVYTKTGKTGDCHGKIIISRFQHGAHITVMCQFVDNPDEFVCFRRHQTIFKAIQDT